MVPRRNSKQAAATMERATSAELRWYNKDHNVTPNKNVEIPRRKETLNDGRGERIANTDHKE